MDIYKGKPIAIIDGAEYEIPFDNPGFEITNIMLEMGLAPEEHEKVTVMDEWGEYVFTWNEEELEYAQDCYRAWPVNPAERLGIRYMTRAEFAAL